MRRLAIGLVLAPGLAVLAQTSASAQAKPSENQQPAATASSGTPAASQNTPKPGMPDHDRQVELVSSPVPRSLEDWLGASQLLPYIQLCDPVPCLGEPPRLLRIDGTLTIRFPSTYAKPDSSAKAPPQPAPAPAKPADEKPAPRK